MSAGRKWGPSKRVVATDGMEDDQIFNFNENEELDEDDIVTTTRHMPII